MHKSYFLFFGGAATEVVHGGWGGDHVHGTEFCEGSGTQPRRTLFTYFHYVPRINKTVWLVACPSLHTPVPHILTEHLESLSFRRKVGTGQREGRKQEFVPYLVT